jgi:Chaperone of endosialidase
MPPAYEVLLLNTAIPQIQAAQSGDTYLCPRELAVVVNTATDAVRITQTGTGNALLVEDSANPDSTPFVVTATGDVGIGTSSPTGYLANKLVIATGTDSNNGITIASATNRNGAIWFADGTTGSEAYRGGVDYQHTTDTLYLYSGGQGNFQLTAAGNLGLGVTPSVWSSASSPAFQLPNGAALFSRSGSTFLGQNFFYNSSDTGTYIANGFATLYNQASGQHQWFNAPSGTAGNVAPLTQAMTLDASGNLLVGDTNTFSAYAKVHALNGVAMATNSTNGGALIGATTTGTELAYLSMGQSYNLASTGEIALATTGAKAILFGIANGEKARITSGGYFKASNNGTYNNLAGTYHEFYQTASDPCIYLSNSNGAPEGLAIRYVTDSNGTGNLFLNCVGNATQRAAIRSNGGLANYQSNNVDLSDIRTKTDISPLASYWSKIAALEIVTYKYKDQTHDDLNIGVIAQQVEQVAPEFVDADGFGETPEDGVPLKTIYNKDLTFAAIKALQEAMARIEKLEAEVAALKGA